MRRTLPLLLSAAMLMGAAPAPRALDGAQPAPAVLPLRAQAALIDADLKDRLDTIVPKLMRDAGIDMWVLVAREYMEDPVVDTMLDARSLHARRRTIIVFYDPGAGKPIERLTVSRYGLAGLIPPAWKPEEQPDQWKALAGIILQRNPKKIALDVSPLTAFADGLTHGQYEELTAALPPEYQQRIVSAEPLAIGWLETRSAAQLKVYPGILAIAHSIITEAFSSAVVKPGVTTTADVQWWMRQKIAALGLTTWFHPSIDAFRPGAPGGLDGDTVIQPGDMLWCDFGITYMRLNTDTQQLAYVLKPGETDAPAGLKKGLATANRLQDILIAQYRPGATGNSMLAAARKQALSEGIVPSIYSHPIGYAGHAAGAPIGFWDNQGSTPMGDWPLHPDTGFSIELNATVAVPEWGGAKVPFRLEDDGWYDGQRFHWLDGQQKRFHLIG
ncbi:M24 family metallopeptidase [Sphingomonas nostoxanthinifaciens]|uniref:M24 family metallopeptidase n=1 Tax=Sphingomonas nostoxanthinifaciens TaxID=2872652 RepID=UPI001CC1CACE|nr:M24 family metallopeptidase [Sphingomonas nostoxanthinifaciens]UAK25973.1 aminopeptidase P family protein [Sphingomonas nostoxanthinifaciens]